MKKIHKKQSNGDKLAKYFQKSYGEIVYSGALAIETALFSAGINKDDCVLLPDGVCYRILLSVVRLQAKPIIVTPANGVILTTDDIRPVLRKHKLKAVILVHNQGIPVNIKSFSNLLKDTVIIEDASQAWRLKYSGFPIGRHSDYVVTSFGKTKPLGFGVGGALFSNSNSFKKYLDYNNKESRMSSDAILPYALPGVVKIDIGKLIALGNENFRNSVYIADILLRELNYPGIRVWKLGKDDIANWHKFPIFIDSKKVYSNVLALAEKHHIHYELPHKLRLSKTALALKNDSRVIDNTAEAGYSINLFTAENKSKNIRSWIKEIEEKLR